jgi:hypothetical protein
VVQAASLASDTAEAARKKIEDQHLNALIQSPEHQAAIAAVSDARARMELLQDAGDADPEALSQGALDVLDAQTNVDHLEQGSFQADRAWVQADATYRQAQATLQAERAKLDLAMKQDPRLLAAQQTYAVAVAAVQELETTIANARAKVAAAATTRAQAQQAAGSLPQQIERDQSALQDLRNRLDTLQ